MELVSSTQFSSPNENVLLLRNINWTFPVVRSLTWNLEFVSNIWFMMVELKMFDYRSSGTSPSIHLKFEIYNLKKYILSKIY